MAGLDYTEAGEKTLTATMDNKPKEEDNTPKEDKTKVVAEANAIGSQEEKEVKEVAEKKEVGDDGKKEAKEKDEPTLNKFFDENPDKKSLSGKADLKVKDGDFEEKEDGTIIVRSEHLMKDVEAMIQNPQKFFKIRKANPKKAELFTKWMGMSRSDGKPDVDKMASVLNEFLIAKTPEEEKSIIDDNFPEWLSEGKLPFKFEPKEVAKSEKEISKDVPYSHNDLSDAIDSFVEDYSKTKVDSQPNLTSEEIWDDAKFLEALKANTHNPSGGKLRTPSEITKIAMEKAFDLKSEKPVVTQGGKGGTKIQEDKKSVSLKPKGPSNWY